MMEDIGAVELGNFLGGWLTQKAVFGALIWSSTSDNVYVSYLDLLVVLDGNAIFAPVLEIV
jgi:hypothetical protein